MYSTCAREGQVALTFDDGPYKYLKGISDQLTKHGAKGKPLAKLEQKRVLTPSDNPLRDLLLQCKARAV